MPLYINGRRQSEAAAQAPATQEFLYEPDFNANFGEMRTRSIGGTGAHRFSFRVPHDFSTLVDLVLIGFPANAGGSGAGKDIDLFSEYGAPGELQSNTSEAEVTSTFTLGSQAEEIFEMDLSSVFGSLKANDVCGVQVDHNGVGGTIHYLGVRLRYQ